MGRDADTTFLLSAFLSKHVVDGEPSLNACVACLSKNLTIEEEIIQIFPELSLLIPKDFVFLQLYCLDMVPIEEQHTFRAAAN
jgi:hypothetical protein